MSLALVWFRRDLRLHDHPALAHALASAERVVPVYIWAPEEEGDWAPGAASRWWLHHSLASLQESLRKAGSPLVVRRGASAKVLLQIVGESGATAVYWNRLIEPLALKRDAAVRGALEQAGIAVQDFNGSLLLEPGALRTGGGQPYKVFTPFWNAAQQRIGDARPLPAPRRLAPPAQKVASESLESLGLLPRIRWDAGFTKVWTPGEKGALERLADFDAPHIAAYPPARDRPDREGTSRLSPHLHFGELSPRQIVARLRRAQLEAPGAALDAGVDQFLKEVGWREFGQHLLWHFPTTPEQPLDLRFKRLPTRNSAAEVRRWQRGQTGFPIVDAGMRQLWATGWMHNRVRMIVASFLTKNLLMRWQDGARWFWDTLVDADLGNNTLGWQWTAGCGADAAPYFRIFNPVLQGERFDPQGDYVRRWVPELRGLAGAAVHAPWESSSGRGDYPERMVDLAATRARALEAFAKLKKPA